MTPPLDPSPAGDVPEMDPEQLLREFPPKPKDEAYLRALVARRVIGSVRDQTEAFAAGFGSVVPPPLQAPAPP